MLKNSTLVFVFHGCSEKFYITQLELIPQVFNIVQVIKVEHEAHGVDTPEDVEKIESLMRERNLS